MTLQKATSVIKDTLKGGDLFGRQYETAKKIIKKDAGLTSKGALKKNASFRLYCDLIECEQSYFTSDAERRAFGIQMDKGGLRLGGVMYRK